MQPQGSRNSSSSQSRSRTSSTEFKSAVETASVNVAQRIRAERRKNSEEVKRIGSGKVAMTATQQVDAILKLVGKQTRLISAAMKADAAMRADEHQRRLKR